MIWKCGKGTESLIGELNIETQLQCKINEQLLRDYPNTKAAQRGGQGKSFSESLKFEVALEE